MITAGVNAKSGGASDRSDPAGRLKLLKTNAEVSATTLQEAIAGITLTP